MQKPQPSRTRGTRSISINDVVVCVPHTPDPVLFGIRGESSRWVMAARRMIESEKPGIEQIWVTNQGTDAHIRAGRAGELVEGLSYRIRGTVAENPKSGPGGHVSLMIHDGGNFVRCMAYEPTKNFRQIIRQLVPGDEVIAVGSYKKGSINLEKIGITFLARPTVSRPPLCTACTKRMTSDGKRQGMEVQEMRGPVGCAGGAGNHPLPEGGMVRSSANCTQTFQLNHCAGGYPRI